MHHLSFLVLHPSQVNLSFLNLRADSQNVGVLPPDEHVQIDVVCKLYFKQNEHFFVEGGRVRQKKVQDKGMKRLWRGLRSWKWKEKSEKEEYKEKERAGKSKRDKKKKADT